MRLRWSTHREKKHPSATTLISCLAARGRGWSRGGGPWGGAEEGHPPAKKKVGARDTGNSFLVFDILYHISVDGSLFLVTLLVHLLPSGDFL